MTSAPADILLFEELPSSDGLQAQSHNIAPLLSKDTAKEVGQGLYKYEMQEECGKIYDEFLGSPARPATRQLLGRADLRYKRITHRTKVKLPSLFRFEGSVVIPEDTFIVAMPVVSTNDTTLHVSRRNKQGKAKLQLGVPLLFYGPVRLDIGTMAIFWGKQLPTEPWVPIQYPLQSTEQRLLQYKFRASKQDPNSTELPRKSHTSPSPIQRSHWSHWIGLDSSNNIPKAWSGEEWSRKRQRLDEMVLEPKYMRIALGREDDRSLGDFNLELYPETKNHSITTSAKRSAIPTTFFFNQLNDDASGTATVGDG